MFEACKNGETKVVQFLLERCDAEESGLNIKDNEGFNALMVACKNGHKEVVRLLLENSEINIDLNARCNGGYSALMLACIYGHKNVVQLFLSSRHWGAAAPKTVKRRRMLQNSSNPRIEVNAKNNDGSTAFIIACKRGHKDIVELLLECSEIDGIDVSGYKDLPQEMKGFIDSYLLKLSQF